MSPLNIPGIENGWKVDDQIWRGAQPSSDAFRLLASAGAKSVLRLNGDGDPSAEILQAEQLAIHYSLQPWSGIVPPTKAEVDYALGMLDQLPKPVFIHCAQGSDRTGVLCAIWRMYHDKWTFEQAMEEAFFGLGPRGLHEFWMASAVAEYACALNIQ